jgi:hypothetical protein
LGHQAANCTNGTINWRQIYGDEAFRLKEPIYPSDIYRMTKEKEVDFTDLEKRAQEWAKVRVISSHEHCTSSSRPLGGYITTS